MSFFGEKAVCPQCGAKVRKPKDPGDYLCPKCLKPGPWASEEQISAWRGYTQLIESVESTTIDQDAAHRIDQAAEDAGIGAATNRAQKLEAVVRLALALTHDDLLTEQEGQQLTTTMSSLGITQSDLQAKSDYLNSRIQVASINAGFLPVVATPQLMAKQGEIVHLEWPATLMKEVAIREYKGGYSGFSFPVGKTGIRYKVGGSRGQSVQVGTKLDVADTGTLTITNKRAVYLGSRKTVDMPYSKLNNVTVYTDGVQFHLSNRVNAPLFMMKSGSDMVAAVVHAAAQRAPA